LVESAPSHQETSTPPSGGSVVSRWRQLSHAAELVDDADGLLITAGAGIGVDSGLPDFRGSSGFWQAYPALGRARIDFTEIANPQAFRHDPALAWGFYGHRLNMYRETVPHEGFNILRRWAADKPHGAFVFTSNVDGQFQKAGFSEGLIHECHGSIHWLQCTDSVCGEVWSAADFKPEVDEERCRLVSPMPRCSACGQLARPNILMFGDGHWVSDRYDEQDAACFAWLRSVKNPVVIELGAGTAVPSVRFFGEYQGVPMIRINVRESESTMGNCVSLPMGALEALQVLDGLY
jgi:NAD-dependent SIR2 family protein deacetylase